MTVGLLTDEQLQAVLERTLEPLRAELARLRAMIEAEGVPIPEAARRLGVSERTVKRRIRDKTLPSTLVGGARRVLIAPLMEGEPPPPVAAGRGQR